MLLSPEMTSFLSRLMFFKRKIDAKIDNSFGRREKQDSGRERRIFLEWWPEISSLSAEKREKKFWNLISPKEDSSENASYSPLS